MIKILYIEDDSFDSKYIQSLASKINEFATLEIAHTLSDGLEKMLISDYDCVLLDLSLPDSKGLETIEIVKQNQPLLPLVVFTGLNDQHSALQAINKGAQDYLIKGEITVKLLKKSVFYAIERHKNEQELQRVQKNLTKAESLAKLGNWEYNLKDGSFHLSAGMLNILDLEHDDQIKSIDDYYSHVLSNDKPKVKKVIANISKMLKPISYTERVITKTGLVKHLETTVDCQLTDLGQLISLFGVTIDASERRKTENQLKESEDKLIEAQEFAKIGNWEYDFVIKYHNLLINIRRRVIY